MHGSPLCRVHCVTLMSSVGFSTLNSITFLLNKSGYTKTFAVLYRSVWIITIKDTKNGKHIGLLYGNYIAPCTHIYLILMETTGGHRTKRNPTRTFCYNPIVKFSFWNELRQLFFSFKIFLFFFNGSIDYTHWLDKRYVSSLIGGIA